MKLTVKLTFYNPDQENLAAIAALAAKMGVGRFYNDAFEKGEGMVSFTKPGRDKNGAETFKPADATGVLLHVKREK